MTDAAPPQPRPHLGASFAKLWSASLLSNLADGVLKVAIPLVAVRLTDSPLLIGALGVAMALPWLVFALPAGALADRVDRRVAMLVANGTRGLVAGLLALTLLTDLGSIWVLYVAGFVLGVAEVLYDTTAQSILPQVVDRSALTTANSRLYGAETVANQFVGPPLGGLLLGAGVAIAVGAPAALWALAFLALAWIPGRFRVERTGPATTLRSDIAEGLRYLAGHRVLRMLALMTGTSNFASSAAFSVFVLYAVGEDSPMGLTDFGYGVLNTTSAVGAVAGSFFAASLSKAIGRAWSLGLGVITFTAMVAVPILTSNAWVIGAVWVLSGAGVMVWNVIAVSLRQQVTPDRLLGRMNSCYRLLAWGTMPVGALVGGLVGEAFGLIAVFWVATIISALTGLGLLVVTDKAIAQAEADAEEQARALAAAEPEQA
ncbi:MFS transporter [Antribacter gilvus]|uniref:MFS transporter n=1 Tax=Antribacter gilvus TaxID=2304675 RepID=UPI000F773B27|nr:MFS transporter [Antribacter gilvus]